MTTVWADERVYYPLHAEPYTPAARFPKKRADPDFRTKLQIAADLMTKAHAAGVTDRAVVGACFYGDHDDLRAELRQRGWGFVMSLKPSRGTWQYGADAYTPKDAARAVPWGGPDVPGGWSPVQRTLRDGHTETWWATDAQLGWRGPDGHTRLVIATTDPGTLPDKATWYLATNLPRPGGPHDTPGSAHEPADLTEVVRLYGIRHWIEQSYNRSRTNSAGPTSKSAPPPRSDATKPSSTARSRSAGTPGSTHHPQTAAWSFLRNRQTTTPARGGPRADPPAEHPRWPKALRAVRAWLAPWLLLQRCWRAWTDKPPPAELQQLLNALKQGHAINLYLPP